MLMVNFYGFSCRDEYVDCTASTGERGVDVRGVEWLGALSEKSRLGCSSCLM